ncbi:MAG TPA: response regulator transcription factor [Pyrinomonadaceae bacterium]|nr:response regulator transcription factor [Pyrinomonadaceae bacterium]
MATLALIDDDKTDQAMFAEMCRRGSGKTSLELIAGPIFDSGEQCLANCDPYQIDVLLVDLGLPALCGPELIRTLRKTWPRLRIMIWTGSALARDLRDCLREGISGYMLKGPVAANAGEDFATAMHEVINGCGYYLDSRLYRFIFERLAEPLPSLTARERRILGSLKLGYAAKEIAGALGISEETVKQHAETARHKCGAKNTMEAIYLYQL